MDTNKITDQMRNEIIEFLKSGTPVKQIATTYKLDVSTIYRMRRKYLVNNKSKIVHVISNTQVTGDVQIDLDTAISQWTKILEEAKNSNTLRARVNTLENQLAAARNELEILRHSIDERSKQKLSFMLAQQNDIREH